MKKMYYTGWKGISKKLIEELEDRDVKVNPGKDRAKRDRKQPSKWAAVNWGEFNLYSKENKMTLLVRKCAFLGESKTGWEREPEDWNSIKVGRAAKIERVRAAKNEEREMSVSRDGGEETVEREGMEVGIQKQANKYTERVERDALV